MLNNYFALQMLNTNIFLKYLDDSVPGSAYKVGKSMNGDNTFCFIDQTSIEYD